MHEKAIEQLGKNIVGTMINCEIEESFPVFDSVKKHLESLSKHILQSKKEWLSEADVYYIFYDNVSSSLEQSHPKKYDISGKLETLLSEDEFKKLATSIKEYLISIPREYDVYLPLPMVKGINIESFEIFPGIWLKSFTRINENALSRDIGGGISVDLEALSEEKLENKTLYLCIRQKGYCGN